MLAANLETAINGLWDANPHIGDRVVVVGAGTVGCLVAWLAGRIHGCDVELVDVNPKRAAVAQALGVRFSEPEAVAGGADVVVHASGSAAGLGARAPHRRIRGDDRRDELVRRPDGARCRSARPFMRAG